MCGRRPSPARRFWRCCWSRSWCPWCRSWRALLCVVGFNKALSVQRTNRRSIYCKQAVCDEGTRPRVLDHDLSIGPHSPRPFHTEEGAQRVSWLDKYHSCLTLHFINHNLTDSQVIEPHTSQFLTNLQSLKLPPHNSHQTRTISSRVLSQQWMRFTPYGGTFSHDDFAVPGAIPGGLEAFNDLCACLAVPARDRRSCRTRAELCAERTVL